MSDTFSRVAIITGVARRRRFTTEQKLAVVGETMPARHVHQLVSRSACASSSAVLGRKTLEVEILKESRKALDLARAKKDLAVELCTSGRFPMKTVTDTLGLARSNIAEASKARVATWPTEPPERSRDRCSAELVNSNYKASTKI